jgi:hypothetical protein
MAATDARKSPFFQWLASDSFARLWHLVIGVVLVTFLVLCARQTALRAIFPWDMHIWSESPFITNLLKLDHGSPIYTAPAEVNSFVYSPGLEYLTYAFLKPFGVELDIRYCRLVNILIGLGAAAFGALAIRRLGRSCTELGMGPGTFFATWAALVLILFKNFTSDIPHPDNVHAFHALLVFYLCFTALETKSFRLALVTMLLAGLGVLAKQTDVLCAAGPATVFLLLNPFGRNRALILIVAGAIVSGLSLWCLWAPQYARFYTFELLAHQNRHWDKIGQLIVDLLRRERGMLVLLSIFTIPYLLNLQGATRRYLICALAVGFFVSVLTTASYIKEFGAWNNLCALEIFMGMLVWPLVWGFPYFLQTALANNSAKLPVRLLAFGVLAGVLIISLCPIKNTPQPGYYEYCQSIESSVRNDLKAGRKVMVSHGAEFLIRAGDREIPLDRANSSGELFAGSFGHLAGTDSRLRARYYDRIYLIVDFGFEPTELDNFHRYYEVVDKVPAYCMQPRRGYASGFQYLLTGDCEILAPKTK